MPLREFLPNRKSQSYFGYDDGTIYLGLEAVAKLSRPGIVCMHCENWEIARITQAAEHLGQGF